VTTKQEDPQLEVDRLAGEIAELEKQASAARQSAEEAERRLQAIDNRSAEIASKSFAGDQEATREIESLEEETIRVTRALKVARAAAEDFARQISEVDHQRKRASRKVHQQRYAELSEQSQKLVERRDELLDEVVEILDEEASLHYPMTQELSHWMPREAERMSERGIRGAIQDDLRSKFSRWLH